MKRGQMGLLIIVAVVIAAIIVSFFFIFYQGRKPFGGNQEFNPKSFIEGCIESSAYPAVKTMLKQGGFIYPDKNNSFVLYNDTKTTYLCEINTFHDGCVNEHPAIIDELNKEIESNISNKIDLCFRDLANISNEVGYNVSFSDVSFNASFVPGQLVILVKTNLTMEYHEQVSSFRDFKVYVPTYLYDLSNVAENKIISGTDSTYGGEALFCGFNYGNYMNDHREIKISMDPLDDGSKIYSVRSIISNEVYYFAIRSCVINNGGGLFGG